MELSGKNKIGAASGYFTTDPSECVKIFNNKSSENLMTIPELFAKTVKLYPDRSAMMYRPKKDDSWISISYSEYKNRVDQIAKAFLKLGLERKGSVAVLAFNSVEWFVSKLAAIHAGGQIVGIYSTNSAEACRYILEKSRANIIVVDEDAQLQKILEVKDKLPNLKAIIQTLPSKINNNEVLKWIDLEKMDTEEFENEYQKRLQEIKVNSCCCMVFTSGTTGNPKGAMLSHDNVMFCVKSVIDLYGFNHKNPEITVSYLPLSHIAGSMVDVFTSIVIAGTIYFADKNALKGTLLKTLRDARPTFFFGVPRVYEKFQEFINHEIQKSSRISQFVTQAARNIVLNYHLNSKSGKSTTPISYSFSKRFIINRFKTLIGLDRCSFFLTGAAPFNLDVLKYFMSLDIPIYEAYGMTEVCITFGNTSNGFKLGSVGKCVPNTEAKISNPDSNGVGEICFRGRNSFMGYIDDLEKTREIFDEDLWIRSGDLGYIDNDGFLFLTGRIKELIITAGGENIPFLNIENTVKSECSAISNAFLVGDKKKYLTILITLKTVMDNNGAPTDKLTSDVIQHIKSLDLKYELLSEVLSSGPDPKILDLIKEAINRANQRAASNAQKVQKFLILPNDFSQATGELGPTMKLKRNFVVEKYKKEIDQLYEAN